MNIREGKIGKCENRGIGWTKQLMANEAVEGRTEVREKRFKRERG